MASDVWLRTTLINREEAHFNGYSFRVAAKDLLYAQPTDRIVHITNIVVSSKMCNELKVYYKIERATTHSLKTSIRLLKQNQRPGI